MHPFIAHNVNKNKLSIAYFPSAQFYDGKKMIGRFTGSHADGVTLIYFWQKLQDCGHESRTMLPLSFISQYIIYSERFFT